MTSFFHFAEIHNDACALRCEFDKAGFSKTGFSGEYQTYVTRSEFDMQRNPTVSRLFAPIGKHDYLLAWICRPIMQFLRRAASWHAMPDEASFMPRAARWSQHHAARCQMEPASCRAMPDGASLMPRDARWSQHHAARCQVVDIHGPLSLRNIMQIFPESNFLPE